MIRVKNAIARTEVVSSGGVSLLALVLAACTGEIGGGVSASVAIGGPDSGPPLGSSGSAGFSTGAGGSNGSSGSASKSSVGGSSNRGGTGALGTGGNAPLSTGGTLVGNGGVSAAGAGGGMSTPPVKGFQINPAMVSVAAGATQQFTCTLDGAPGKCTYAVTEAEGGTISAAGIYAAPGQGGSYHVVATSTTDATKKATATVTVRASAVGACNALPDVGKWENVTPPEVVLGGGEHGTYAFVVDPVNTGTVYLGTLRQKMWKSTDCGATWTKLNTGKNGAQFDTAIEWSWIMDPTDSKVQYVNSGYGANGAYKTTNGGTDWEQVWPPPNQPELNNVVQYNFVNVFAMDPADHLHILMTFHAVCSAPYNQTCIAETTDGGVTWRLMSGDASWSGTEGQVVYFLENRNTWLFGSQSNNFWRTEDAGKTWKPLSPTIKEAHPQGSALLRTKDGTFFLAASDGISKSTDGKAWSLIPNTGPLAGGLVTDGVTMYLSTDFYGSYGTDLKPYLTSPESPGTQWTKMDSPGMSSGGILAYDPTHKLLYSSNLQAGFYRVRVK